MQKKDKREKIKHVKTILSRSAQILACEKHGYKKQPASTLGWERYTLQQLEQGQDVLIGLLLVVVRRRGGAGQIEAREPIHQITSSSAIVSTTR